MLIVVATINIDGLDALQELHGPSTGLFILKSKTPAYFKFRSTNVFPVKFLHRRTEIVCRLERILGVDSRGLIPGKL